jgi:nucleoside-diphosphate-sugar epimerase
MNLITGGTGLVGAHLLYYLLKKGEACKALFRNADRLQVTRQIFSYYPDGASLFNEIEWVEGNVLDVVSLENAFRQVKRVYHCAGFVSFNPADRQQLLKTNVEGTANVVNVALSNNIVDFCHVSSIASFGRALRNKKVNEETHWENNAKPSGYSLSKYLAEQEVWRGAEEGLSVVIVNPAAILGAGNWNYGSSALFGKVKNGLPWYTSGVNGFVDVKDVVKCMHLLMQSTIRQQRFILVSENLPFRTLFDKMADHFGVKRPTKSVSQFWSGLICVIEKVRSSLHGKAPVITSESARIAYDKQYYANNKIVEALSFEFTPIDETIKGIVADYQKQSPTSSLPSPKSQPLAHSTAQ